MKQNRRSWIAWGAVALSLIVGAVGTTPRAALGQTDLLTNGNFEGTFTGSGDTRVAANWTAWNSAIPDTAPGFVLPPEYRPAQNRARILAGSAAQELSGFFAIFDGGIYQTVNVTPGTTYEFKTSVNIWSTQGDDEAKSEDPSEVSVQVGIDPTGGTNGEASTVQYSSAQEYYDVYKEQKISAAATGNKLTVFVRVKFVAPTQHNFAYIDNASLIPTGSAPATTATPRTQTAVPTTPVVAASTTPPRVATVATPQIVITRDGTLTNPATTEVPASTNTLVPPTRVPTLVPPTLVPTVVTPTLVPSPTDTAPLPGTATLFVPSPAPVDPNPTAQPLFPSNTPIPSATPTLVPTNTVAPTNTPVVTATAPADVIPLTGPTVNGIGTYIVQPGDRFGAIAARYNISISDLARLNGILNPNRIAFGTVLVVPGPGNNYPGGTIAPTAFPTSIPVRTYVVQPGDYLISIATRFAVTPEAILQANQLVNPNLIYAGQTLRIP